MESITSTLDDTTESLAEASLDDLSDRKDRLSPFERLPGEIRNEIYKWLFEPR